MVNASSSKNRPTSNYSVNEWASTNPCTQNESEVPPVVHRGNPYIALPEVSPVCRGNQYVDHDHYQQSQQTFGEHQSTDLFHHPVASDTHLVRSWERNRYRSNFSDMNVPFDYTHSESSVPQYIPPLMSTSIGEHSRQSNNFIHYWSDNDGQPCVQNENSSSYGLASEHESHFWSKRNDTQLPNNQQFSTIDDVPNCPVFSEVDQSNSVSSDDHFLLHGRYNSTNNFAENLPVEVFDKKDVIGDVYTPSSEGQHRQSCSLSLDSDPSFRLHREADFREQLNVHEAKNPVPLMSLSYQNEDFVSSNCVSNGTTGIDDYERQPHLLFSRLGDEVSQATADTTYYTADSAVIADQSFNVLNRLGSKVDNSHISNMQYNNERKLILENYSRVKTKADVMSRLGPQTEPRSNACFTNESEQPSYQDVLHLTPGKCDDKLLTKGEPWIDERMLGSSHNNSTLHDQSEVPTILLSSNPDNPSSSLLNKVVDSEVNISSSVFSLPFGCVDGNDLYSSRSYDRIKTERRQSSNPFTACGSPKSNTKSRSSVFSKEQSTSKQNSGHKVSNSKISVQRAPSVKSREFSKNAAKLLESAKLAIGNFARRLDYSKGNLLQRLWGACAIVMKVHSEEIRLCSKSEVVKALCNHFPRFFSNDLISMSSFPNSNKLLFSNLLRYLKTRCEADLCKWRENIIRFASLAETVDTALKGVTKTHSEEESVSPPPLVIDLNTADPVGYAPDIAESTKCFTDFGTSISSDVHDARTLPQPSIEKDERKKVVLALANTSGICNSVNGVYSVATLDEQKKTASSESKPLTCQTTDSLPRVPHYSECLENQHVCGETLCKPSSNSLKTILCGHNSAEVGVVVEPARFSPEASSALTGITNISQSIKLCESPSDTINVLTEPVSSLQQCKQSVPGSKFKSTCNVSTTTVLAEPLKIANVSDCIQLKKNGSSKKSFSSIDIQKGTLECTPIVHGCEKQVDTSFSSLVSDDLNQCLGTSNHVTTNLKSTKTADQDYLSSGEIVSTSPSPSPPPLLEEIVTQKRKGREYHKNKNQRERKSYCDQRDSYSRQDSNAKLYRQSKKRKKSRSSFEEPKRFKPIVPNYNSVKKGQTLDSDEELELLDLRKKALMSMIVDKKTSPVAR